MGLYLYIFNKKFPLLQINPYILIKHLNYNKLSHIQDLNQYIIYKYQQPLYIFINIYNIYKNYYKYKGIP